MAGDDSAPLPGTPEYQEHYEREAAILKTLRPHELKAILRRLGDIGNSLRSIHALSLNAICATDINEHEAYAIAIGEMARANFKGLDAAMTKLGDGPFGTWENELEVY